MGREVLEGFRENRGFESVAVREVGGGGVEVWAGMEAALVGDGGEATAEGGTLCRVLVFDGGSGARVREVFYETEAAPRGIGGVGSFNSLAEMCGVGGGCVLFLERSFSLARGWGAEVFVCDGSVEARDGVGLPVLRKRRVCDVRALGVVVMGNLEGMAVGPRVSEVVGDEGEVGRVVVLVADDNFGRDGQVGSQVVVLRVGGGG